MFATYSGGLNSARDSWVYNFSAEKVRTNIASMIDFYNSQVDGYAAHIEETGAAPSAKDIDQWIDTNPQKISWNVADKTRLAKREKYVFDAASMVTSTYRPFTRQHLYFHPRLIERVYQLPRLFPTSEHENLGFYITGPGTDEPFSVLMLSDIPNLHTVGTRSMGPYFARYTYREFEPSDGQLVFGDEETSGYERIDNITDAALAAYRRTYDDLGINKDHIFYYAYGLLHSPAYRARYAADLKKVLPRIPRARDFHAFSEAGRTLAALHLDYEQAEPYPGIVETVTGDATNTLPGQLYRVAKMKFPKTKGITDRSTIIYNHRVTLTNIPEEAYRYQFGGRSAIEWIIDRYQVKVDKASEITNDPNDWSDDPRYIIDLLKRIVTVSLETMKIVDGLPSLDILE